MTATRSQSPMRTLRLALRPRTINPIRLLFGPIFQMEVRTAGRRKSTYFFRFCFAAVVLFFFTIILASTWLNPRDSSSTLAMLQSGQNIAPQLATSIIWTQYVGLILLAPIITGPALCDERRTRTLAALLTTPLSAWEIVLGKLTGRLSQAIILAIVSVPMVFAARLLGGISAEGIFAAVAITLVSVLQCAALALLLSARSSRAVTAAVSAFLLFLLINFGPLIAGFIYTSSVRTNFPSLPSLPQEWMFFTSLPISLGLVTARYFSAQPIGMANIGWGYSMVYGGAVTILAIFASGLLLRRAMRKDPDELDHKPPREKRRRLRRAAANTGIDHEQPGLQSRIVSDRPILWRELRHGARRRRRQLRQMLLVLTISFTLLYITNGLTDELTHMLITIVGSVTFILQASLGTASTIPAERESRTLEVLMTTPIRPRAIVLGKLIASIRRLWLLPAALLVHFSLASALGVLNPIIIILMPLALFPAAILLSATGMLTGAFFSKTVTAAAANLFLAVLLYLGGPVMLSILEDAFNLWGDPAFTSIYNAVVSINPVAMAGVSVLGTGVFDGSADLSFSLPNGTLGLISFLTLLTVAALIQLLLACGATALATRILADRFGRPS